MLNISLAYHGKFHINLDDNVKFSISLLAKSKQTNKTVTDSHGIIAYWTPALHSTPLLESRDFWFADFFLEIFKIYRLI